MTTKAQTHIPNDFWDSSSYHLLQFANSIGKLSSVNYSEWLLGFELETKGIHLSIIVNENCMLVHKKHEESNLYDQIFMTPTKGCTNVFETFWRELEWE